MLEGLEISEVSNLALERTVRLDSEFYKKENLITLDLLKRHEILNLTEITKVSDGNHNAISEKFQDTGIPYYRGQDVSSFFVENAEPMCIDKDTFHLPVMKRSHLKKGDVLLSIVGTIGKLSLVYSDKQATCSCKLAILRPFGVSAEFLAIFLESKYGQNQIKKFTRGAVQMGLILEDANQIFIPQLSKPFQQQIEDLVKSAHSTQETSKNLYQEAENLLLSELGIDENVFKVSKNEVVTNVKSFADFESSWRLDAEYYQPKYEILEGVIEKYGFVQLRNIIEKVTTGFTYESSNFCEKGIPLIRISNISKTGLNISNAAQITIEDAALSPKDKAEKGEVLISMSGSIGLSCVIREEIQAFVNQRIMKFKPVGFDADVLSLLINSEIVRKQLERVGTGGVQTNLSNTDILEIKIPNLNSEFQMDISNKIQESFRLKTKSEQLLSLAKRAVELAIEEGEDVAMAWITERK